MGEIRYFFRFREMDGGWSPWEEITRVQYAMYRMNTRDCEVTTTQGAAP